MLKPVGLAHRNHHAAARLELLDERRRHVAGRNGDHEAVEGRAFRPAVVAVADPGRNLVVAEPIDAWSVLLAPSVYLTASRTASAFDSRVCYENLRPALTGEDLVLLDRALNQALTPYQPTANIRTMDFFPTTRILWRTSIQRSSLNTVRTRAE